MRIEISIDADENAEFVEWLNSKGCEATIGTTTGNYVDGVSTSHDVNANNILADLWGKYCS